MWRKFFKIFGCRVIQTMDFDGEVRARFLRKDAFGYWCYLWFVMEDQNYLRLNEDGSVSNVSWVKKWKEI